MRVIQAIHREEEGCMMVSLLFKAKEQLFDPDDLPRQAAPGPFS